MRTFLLYFLLFLYSLSCFAFNHKIYTGKKPKVKSTTSNSKDNDDPAATDAFCLKYGTSDTIYLRIDNSICGNYELTSIKLNANDSLVWIENTTYPFQKLDTTNLLPFIPNSMDSYFVPIYLKIPPSHQDIISNKLGLITVNITPNNVANQLIECSRSKILIYLHISENGCVAPDTILGTGKCYKCEGTVSHSFPTPTYAHFSYLKVGNAFNTVQFTNLSRYQLGDTIIMYYGDGGFDTVSNRNTFVHTYTTIDIFYPEMIIQCKQNKGKCIYKARSKLNTFNPLPIEIIPLTVDENNEHKSVGLKWSCNSAIPAAKYRIERKTVGEQTLVKETENAFWIDTTLEYYKRYYYRIEGIDADGGRVGLSDDIDVFLATKSMIFPNPTTDDIEIIINENDFLPSESTETVLSDLTGKIIFQSQEIPRKIDVRGLPSGTYLLRVGKRIERILKR